MNPLEQFAAALGKTLAEFRDEASKEMNGTRFEALRPDGGKRFMLIVCATGEHQIKILCDTLNFVDSGKRLNWSEVRLMEVVTSTKMRGGLCYECEGNILGRPKSVLLIAADPDSIINLERLFNLTP